MYRSEDPNITYVGIRPGEKLHEALYNEQEAHRVSIHDNGFVMLPATKRLDEMPAMMMYESSHPSKWLSREEMKSLIIDAETV